MTAPAKPARFSPRHPPPDEVVLWACHECGRTYPTDRLFCVGSKRAPHYARLLARARYGLVDVRFFGESPKCAVRGQQ